MSNPLILRNRVRSQYLDLAFMRRVVRVVLEELPGASVRELGIYVVRAKEMTRLNEVFLRHRGVTDVIAFNYIETGDTDAIHGEIFVCVDEARVQARRLDTSWQQELVRYVVHGILHLQGYDDRRKADRLRMKRREDRLVKQLAQTFRLEALSPSRNRIGG